MTTTLIQEVDALQQKIAASAAAHGSVEWYLKNHLDEFAAAAPAGGSYLENAARALMRFCTESMDWDTPLYREAIAIAERGLRLAKG
ncbi:hypothetical protein [Ramlibacter humi]|uniref:Uncharacterized protein n=1 Tax=Ramlibacter humi TaxID=2530451 RepID=A0A4Z0BGN1_9BURK|nr:hypothetical protein [Ramlibacter humi]TFY97068.1 hypothetical protein EZ216_19600 [Ramlibacter humi]